MISARLIERARDVGLVLYECNRHNQPLGRLQLQKLVYLLDSVAVCKLLLTPSEGHEVYFNGPFDSKVQDAVDILVFRGLAQATDITVRPNRHVRCRYEITPAGLEWVKAWRDSLDSLSARAELARELVDAIAYRDAFSRLKQLVYAEPTYSSLRDRGNRFPISLGQLRSNLSAQVLALMDRSFADERVPLTPRFLTEFFLEFLEVRGRLAILEDN